MIEAIHKILCDVLTKAGLSGKLQDTLKSILDSLTNELNIALGSIYLIENCKGEKSLLLAAAKGVQEIDVCVAKYRIGEGITGEIATGCIIKFNTIEERRNHPKYSGKYNHEEEIPLPIAKNCAFLGVPLILDKEVLGVLKLEYLQPTERHPEGIFTDIDVDAIKIIAAIISYIVKSHSSRQDILFEFDLLTKSSILIKQRSAEEDIVLDLLEYLEQSNIGDALISFYNSSKGLIEAKYASNENLTKIIPYTRRNIHSNDILAEVLRTRKAILVPNCRLDVRCDQDSVELSGIISQFVLPLAYGDELIGTMQVDISPKTNLSEEEKLILIALAASVSMAISYLRNLSRHIELANQLMTTSRFLVAETLAGMAIHSIKHRLSAILIDLNKDLQKKEYRERKELYERLSIWKDKLEPLFNDTTKALSIVKAQGEGDEKAIRTNVALELQPAIDLWISLIFSKKCRVEINKDQCEKSLCRIGSPQFKEILSVLIVNSIQAHSKKIEIILDNPSEPIESPLNNLIYSPIRIVVKDDGTGLPTKDHEIIFSPSYTTKHEKFGTGLGLFIGRGLARRAGGDLFVSRLQPDRGACFVLVLPTIEEENG